MINRLANPSPVKQAPDAKALNKTTNLILEAIQGSTPAQAQNYFEPGVNTKLNRRKAPKTNYTLPSDMPELPIGVVPTNKSGRTLGEEPSIIEVRESTPADLLQVFAKISAEQQVLAAQPKYQVDTASLLMKEYKTALKEANLEKKVNFLMEEGYTEEETKKAITEMRAQEALEKAKEPTPATSRSVETALEEIYPKIPAPVPINEKIAVPYSPTTGRSFVSSLESVKERGLGGRPTREQAEEKAIQKAMLEEANKKKQPRIERFIKPNNKYEV